MKSGHYDGTQFHRVIDGFMIQGGGFTADFKEKPTKPPIPIESEASNKAGLSNVPGAVSMARTGDPNSATAQFFINVANNERLNFRSADQAGYGYTVFGKVVDGMDVVEQDRQGTEGRDGSGRPGINPADVPVDASRHQARQGHRRLKENPHGRPARRITATSSSSSTPRTRRRRSTISCNTSATATTTTRCSIA